MTIVRVCICALCLGMLAVTARAQFIVAHRGASYDAPENTLAAFRLAWEQNADAIEGDFYLTQDHQIVCIHDNSTKRTAPTHTDLAISTSTLQQLRELDVGSWKHSKYVGERIPTLMEVLATVPVGKQIFVEIKCGPEILPFLKPQLEESGLKAEQIVIICFDQRVVTEARSLMPQYKANWLTSHKQDPVSGQWKPSLEDVVSGLKDSRATGLGTNGNVSLIDLDYAKAIRSAGTEFHVWTINEPQVAKRLADMGVNSITTDRPLGIRQAIE
ncbi:MAG: glycerophosphodiester phosphodiesterase [Planctomycetales bacterium]|nr:glycerophosphodiester phosphodiesterase [Planctomycetales bacterium]